MMRINFINLFVTCKFKFVINFTQLVLFWYTSNITIIWNWKPKNYSINCIELQLIISWIIISWIQNYCIIISWIQNYCIALYWFNEIIMQQIMNLFFDIIISLQLDSAKIMKIPTVLLELSGNKYFISWNCHVIFS